jgi:hypothetical protein
MAAPNIEASGTLSSTVGSSEETLATTTTSGWYQAVWNLQNMANGDIVELYVYAKVLTGDTAQLVFYGAYRDVQAEKVKVTGLISSPFQLIMKMKHSAGTTRNFPWSLNRA